MALNKTLLFSPVQLGSIGLLKHRVSMAPLTRMRASEPTLAPNPLNVEYYRQRASEGGLLISEATNISMESMAYPSIPGIFTKEQVAGWKQITDGVHSKKGFIVCQLWHTGRVAHPNYAQHELAKDVPAPSVSASDVVLADENGKLAKSLTYKGHVDAAPPRPLRTDEIPRLLDDYRHAARCAREAGFDGVEIHAAHGYLLNQFLDNSINKRTDQYGGSIENRARLLFEVVEAVIGAIGDAGRVAIRLSPEVKFYETRGTDQREVFTYVLKGLNKYNLAYVLLTEDRWKPGDVESNVGFGLPIKNGLNYRQYYQGLLMGGGGFTPNNVTEATKPEGPYDLIAFGRWFISNPDLPYRLREGLPLNVYNRDTFYWPNKEEGYTDYPDYHFTRPDFMVKDKYKSVEQKKIGSSLSAIKL